MGAFKAWRGKPLAQGHTASYQQDHGYRFRVRCPYSAGPVALCHYRRGRKSPERGTKQLVCFSHSCSLAMPASHPSILSLCLSISPSSQPSGSSLVCRLARGPAWVKGPSHTGRGHAWVGWRQGLQSRRVLGENSGIGLILHIQGLRNHALERLLEMQAYFWSASHFPLGTGKGQAADGR